MLLHCLLHLMWSKSEEGAVHPSTDLFGVGQALWQEGPNILPADLHATIAAQDCSDQCRALLHKLPEARGIVRDICARPSFQKKKAREYFDCAKDWRRAFEHWGPVRAPLLLLMRDDDHVDGSFLRHSSIRARWPSFGRYRSVQGLVHRSAPITTGPQQILSFG